MSTLLALTMLMGANGSGSLIWPNYKPPAKTIVVVPVVPVHPYRYHWCPPRRAYAYSYSFRYDMRPARGVLPKEQELLDSFQSRLDEAKKRWKEAPFDMKNTYYKEYLQLKEEADQAKAEIGKKLRGQYK